MCLVIHPLDLSHHRGQPTTAPVLREITDEIMGHVRELVAELRNEPLPDTVYVPGKGARGEHLPPN